MKAFELSPSVRGLLSAESMFYESEAKEAQQDSALRVRHVMVLHWDTFCRWMPTLPSKTRTRWRRGGLFSENHHPTILRFECNHFEHSRM
jgi:hypothetical protein